MALTKADIQTVSITATDLNLGNVTNESKATMFASPAFTGTPTGITATHVGLGNVTNESKSTMFASPTLTGTVNVSTVQEKITVQSASGVTNFDYSNSTVFFVSSIGSNVTAQFINVPTTDARATNFTIIVQQSTVAYLITGVTVNGTAVTPMWLGNVTPSGGTTNRRDVFTFTVLRISGSWAVMASMTSY